MKHCPPGSARDLWSRYHPFFLAALAAVLMALVLFAGGGAGLSNNGDFGRVLSTNSLDYAESTGSFAYEDTFRMVFQGDSAGEKLWKKREYAKQARKQPARSTTPKAMVRFRPTRAAAAPTGR